VVGVEKSWRRGCNDASPGTNEESPAPSVRLLHKPNQLSFSGGGSLKEYPIIVDDLKCECEEIAFNVTVLEHRGRRFLEFCCVNCNDTYYMPISIYARFQRTLA